MGPLRAPCPLLQGQKSDFLLLQETPCAATLAVPHPAAYSSSLLVYKSTSLLVYWSTGLLVYQGMFQSSYLLVY